MAGNQKKRISVIWTVSCLIGILMLTLCPIVATSEACAPISPWEYQAMLGCGMDVDWAKTMQGIRLYSSQTPQDFARAGVDHVRIRVKEDADEKLLVHLERIVQDCLANQLVPIIAYQADAFKNNPSDENLRQVTAWWKTVAERFQDASCLLSFDVMIECTDALNKQPDRLNAMYEHVVAAIRETNPERIVIISPRLRSDPAFLSELVIPSTHNGYLMAEWHFYAAGPSKSNPQKLWTTGTEQEKQMIRDKIELAIHWQESTGIPTWVGAWMPGNYNDENEYSVEEQCAFAAFVSASLRNAGIPFAVNSDTKFYDRENNTWLTERQSVFRVIFENRALNIE